MTQEIYEIRIVPVNSIQNPYAKRMIIDKVSKKGDQFVRNWKGYAKVVYACNSPPQITTIEPIEGTPQDYYKQVGMDSVKPVF